MTCKQLTNKLNTINSTKGINVVKENGYYIIKMGGFESEFCYTLKELVNEVASKAAIEMVYRSWTMNGMKIATIKGIH